MRYVLTGIEWAEFVFLLVGIPFVAAALLFLVFMRTRYGKLWVRSYTTGADLGLFELAGLSRKGIDAEAVLEARVLGLQCGIKDEFSVGDLERHCLAGGRIRHVVLCLVAARRAKIALTWREAAERDLAGREVLPEELVAKTARELEETDRIVRELCRRRA